VAAAAVDATAIAEVAAATGTAELLAETTVATETAAEAETVAVAVAAVAAADADVDLPLTAPCLAAARPPEVLRPCAEEDGPGPDRDPNNSRRIHLTHSAQLLKFAGTLIIGGVTRDIQKVCMVPAQEDENHTIQKKPIVVVLPSTHKNHTPSISPFPASFYRKKIPANLHFRFFLFETL